MRSISFLMAVVFSAYFQLPDFLIFLEVLGEILYDEVHLNAFKRTEHMAGSINKVILVGNLGESPK